MSDPRLVLATRVPGNPIIRPGMDDGIGDNISEP